MRGIRDGSIRRAWLFVPGVTGALTALCLVAGTGARAEPPKAAPAPMGEVGCCCVAIKAGRIGCGPKSQADCLAEQPKTPLYDKLPDWAQAVAESEKDEAGEMKTGWRAGECPK